MKFSDFDTVDGKVINDMSNYFKKLYFCYELPRYGTTITSLVDTSHYQVSLDFSEGKDQNEVKKMQNQLKAFSNSVNNRIDMNWNDTLEKFEIVKKYKGPWPKLVIRNP
jgi:hypothetical protein